VIAGDTTLLSKQPEAQQNSTTFNAPWLQGLAALEWIDV